MANLTHENTKDLTGLGLLHMQSDIAMATRRLISSTRLHPRCAPDFDAVDELVRLRLQLLQTHKVADPPLLKTFLPATKLPAKLNKQGEISFHDRLNNRLNLKKRQLKDENKTASHSEVKQV